VELYSNRGPGSMNEAIFTTRSCFVTDGSGYRPAPESRIEPGRWIEIVFVHQSGRGRLFVDGEPVLETEDGWRRDPGSFGLGVERGTIEVAEFVRFDPGP